MAVKCETTEEGNYKYIDYTGDPKNKFRVNQHGQLVSGFIDDEEVIDYAGLDLDVWEKQKTRLNFWPTSGWDKDTHTPWSVINSQVRVDFIRRNLQPLEPQIQPITIHARKSRRTRPRKSHHGLETCLFVTDPHFGYRRDLKTGELEPFHDRRVLDIALQIANRLRPDVIAFAGDTLDLPDWSDTFIRSPDFYHITQPAIIEASWWFGQFRSASPPSRIIVLEGNHDIRMQNALKVHLNQVYALKPADELDLPPAMSLPRLLALHMYDIDYVDGYPDAYYWLNNAGLLDHGSTARGAPGATVGAMSKQSTVTQVIGHIHRDERASNTIHERHQRLIVRTICPGCACHIDGRVPGKKKRQNWQQGLAVIRYDSDRRVTVNTVTIEEGESIFEGELFRAQEQVKAIQKDTGWPF